MTLDDETALLARVGKFERDYAALNDFAWLELMPRIRRLESNAGIEHSLPPLHERDRWPNHTQPLIPDADPMPGVHHAGHDASTQ